MKTQNKAIAFLGIVVLFGAAFLGFAKSQKAEAPAVSAPVPEKVGALASPDIPYPYFSFGGVRRWAARTETLGTGPFICAIQTPNATSTLVSGAIRIDNVNAATSSTITVAKALTATATTTLINSAALVASAQNQIVDFASTTLSATAFANKTFGPQQWLVVAMASTSGSIFSPTGMCQAVFEQL